MYIVLGRAGKVISTVMLKGILFISELSQTESISAISLILFKTVFSYFFHTGINKVQSIWKTLVCDTPRQNTLNQLTAHLEAQSKGHGVSVRL